MIKSETLTIDTNVDGETVELSRAESGAVSLSIRNYDPDTDTFCERTTDIAKRELAALANALWEWAREDEGHPIMRCNCWLGDERCTHQMGHHGAHSYRVTSTSEVFVRVECNGEHGMPPCSDTQCWLRNPPAIEAP